eukprot:2933367-Amphidinium_carterae.1
MMRDVELSSARLTLPTSKLDPRAHGIERTWRCICGGQLDIVCPFRADWMISRKQNQPEKGTDVGVLSGWTG